MIDSPFHLTDNALLWAGAILAVIAGLAVLALVITLCIRAVRRRDDEATEREIATLTRLQAETAVRIDAMRTMLAGGQADLNRAVNERLDSVTHHLSQSMTSTRQHWLLSNPMGRRLRAVSATSAIAASS